jgi:hypothetical protein
VEWLDVVPEVPVVPDAALAIAAPPPARAPVTASVLTIRFNRMSDPPFVGHEGGCPPFV